MHGDEQPGVSRSAGPRASLLDVLQHPRCQRVYVHDYSDIRIPTLDRQQQGLGNLRAERAVLLAQPGDLVVVTYPIEQDYLSYLTGIGLGPGADSVMALNGLSANAGDQAASPFELLTRPEAMDALAERLTSAPAPRLSTFYGGPGTQRVQSGLQKRLGRKVAMDAGTPRASELANRKDIIRQQAIRLGVPTAPGEVVSSCSGHRPDAACGVVDAVNRQWPRSGGVMVRAAWSGGGLDNLALRNLPDCSRVPEWLADRPHIDTYLVESLLAFSASPNVQMWIEDDGTCVLLEVTNQRLEPGLAHAGNVYPLHPQSAAVAAMEHSALEVARWLSQQGYRGPLGLDFLISPPGHVPDHCFVEVNGRVNGATYGIAAWCRIRQHLAAAGRTGADAWISTKKLSTRCRSFGDLADRAGDLFYTAGGREGAVPYNTGLLSSGAISFIIVARSIHAAAHIEDQLKARLGNE